MNTYQIMLKHGLIDFWAIFVMKFIPATLKLWLWIHKIEPEK